MAKDFPLSLTIRAVDKATAPLRAINKHIHEAFAPVRKLNNSLRALSTEAGLPRLARHARAVGGAMKSVARLGLGVAAMGAGAGYALHRIVRGSVDAGDKLAEMADRVGLSVDAYAQLRHAAAQADVDNEQFNASMDRFNKGLGEARAGGGELLGFLKKAWPNLAPQIQGAKSTEEAFGLMSKAFAKLTDPSEKAALAAAAFGRSGLQMGQFLGQGEKAIAASRDEFFRLAGSQEAFARGAGAMDNAMRNTETAIDSVKNAMVAELFPGLTEMAKALTRLIGDNRETLVTWAKEMGAALGQFVKEGGMDRLVDGLKMLSAAVGQTYRLLKGAAMFGANVSAGPIDSVRKLVKAGNLMMPSDADTLQGLEPTALDFPSLGEPAGAPALGAPAGAAMAGPAAASSETRVTVDFNNLPAGARVKKKSSGPATVDLGYSMAVP